jgi:hypothetical protein
VKVSQKRRVQWNDLVAGDSRQAPGTMVVQRRPAIAPLHTTAATYHWLLSSKHLDLMLLAFCSCLLTVLCHPTMNLTQTATAASSAMQSSSSGSTSQINFYVKSALMSSFQETGKQDEPED